MASKWHHIIAITIFPPETALPFYPPIFANLLLKRASCFKAYFGKMNPLKASRKNLVYLRAQATTLRSSGLSVKEISKLPGKSERWMKKWSSQGEDYADKKRS